jgi:hypothetical protein
MTDSTQKWTDKSSSIIILLILFFPVGVYFMWKNDVFSKSTRRIITIFIGLVVIGGLGSLEGSNSGGGESPSSNTWRCSACSKTMYYDQPSGASCYTGVGRYCKFSNSDWADNTGNNKFCSSHCCEHQYD